MLSLFIDRKPVELPTDLQFTLTRENPLLAPSADYSFDLTLPLRTSVANQAIFGRLHQRGTPLPTRPYRFHLFTAGLDLKGAAYVERADDTMVHLRLVAGHSQLSAITHPDGSPLYLDELEEVRDLDLVPRVDVAVHNPERSLLLGAHDSPLNRVPNLDPKIKRDFLQGTAELPTRTPCLQLTGLLRALFAHFGYSLTFAPGKVQWWGLVHIASARAGARSPRLLLPHWTMAELMKEIEMFFGARLEFEGTNARLVAGSTISTPRYEVQFMADEHQRSNEQPTDRGAQPHPSSLAYDLPDLPPQALLPQGVIDQCEVHRFLTEADAQQKAADMETADPDRLARSLFVVGARRWAWLTHHDTGTASLRPVDHLAPYHPNDPESLDRRAAQTLRIVPARRDAFHILKADNYDAAVRFSLEALLNPRAPQKDKEQPIQPAPMERLEVFLRDPQRRDLLLHPHPLGTIVPYINDGSGLATAMPTPDAAQAFALKTKERSSLLRRMDNTVRITATLADRLPDFNPAAVLAFKGQEFLVRKLTLKLTPQGIAPLWEAELSPLQ